MGSPTTNPSEKTGVDTEHILVTQDSKSGSESRDSDKFGGHSDDESSVSLPHIFSDPVVAEHWRQIYEKAGYENRHRFDPTFSWSAEEEWKLVRKVDSRIVLWAWVMFCGLDLHRRNINRAITDNMLPELGMFFRF